MGVAGEEDSIKNDRNYSIIVSFVTMKEWARVVALQDGSGILISRPMRRCI